jgi:hypothetical protein
VDNSSPNITGNLSPTGIINGGQGAFTRGILITNGANPAFVAGNTISGGTATTASTGILADSASLSGAVSANTINGGTCTSCTAYGILLTEGTPTIGPNNSIDGGSGKFTRGIYVTGNANPTITSNTSISGGTATSASFGIFGDTSSWSGTVSGNTINGGTCAGCAAYGIYLADGTPTIGPNNSIDGGSADFTYGIYVFGSANPKITSNTSISGGTATNESVGIRSGTSSWSGTVSGNTISGGTCAGGCPAGGIYLADGTPTIGPNNSIDGGSSSLFTYGIFITGTANPTITGNTSISGGTAITATYGIYGVTLSWTGKVQGNTISGGTCAGCDAYGIYLSNGKPAIGGPNSSDGNTISAGSGTNTWGVLMFTTPSDFRNNTITGGSGAGFDVDDQRLPGSLCINAAGTKTTNAPGNTSPDDSGPDILDNDGGATDSRVDGPFTFGTELRIHGNFNCLIGIDSGA